MTLPLLAHFAPAIPVVEPAPVEAQAEVSLSTFDLDELPSDNTTANYEVPKDSLRSDKTDNSGADTMVASLEVSVTKIIP